MSSPQEADIDRELQDIQERLQRIKKALPVKQAVKHKPIGNMFGYRWTMGTGGIVYIVKIKILGNYWLDPDVPNMLDYITDDCLIVSIKDMDTGKEVQKVTQPISYFKSTHPMPSLMSRLLFSIGSF